MNTSDAEEDGFIDIDEDDDKTSVQYEQSTVPDQSGRSLSWSMSHMHITYEPTASLLTQPPPPPAPSLNSRESAEVLTDFFMDENGVRIQLGSNSDTEHPTVHPFHDIQALTRSTTTHSTTSLWTISNSDELGLSLELDRLVELIKSHPSLQRAEILSTEGYKQSPNGILHRFIVLELGRRDKSPIWLRIDRRTHPNSSALSFLLAAGKTPAYDLAIFSVNKQLLIKGATFENRQRFETRTTLGDLRYLLEVIREELNAYQLWPANCWFLVSLLQQHLQGDEYGCFVDGSSKWGGTARKIRSRVKERLRLLYHIPLPFTVEDILLSLHPKLNPTQKSLVAKALSNKQWISSHDLRRISASSASGIQTADVLDELVRKGTSLHLDPKALWIRQRSVDITRELSRRDPRRYQRRLALSLQRLGKFLNDLGRGEVALVFLQDAVSLWRSIYVGGSQPFKLIPTLRRYGNIAKTAIRISISVFSRKAKIMSLATRAVKTPFQSNHPISAYFAHCLNILGTVLQSTNKLSEAYHNQLLEEGIPILRELYASNSHRYRGALSNALWRTSVSRFAIGRGESALDYAQEVIELHREQSKAASKSLWGKAASYLNDVGHSLHEAQSFARACVAREEAVKLQRQIFDITSDTHHADLARYLSALGESLYEVRRFSDACSVVQEAVALQRELFNIAPDPNRAQLAKYLFNVASSLFAVERFRDACAAYQEAVKLQRKLYQTAPDPHRVKLAQYLAAFGISLCRVQRFRDACVAQQEAVTLKRELFNGDPDPHRLHLAHYLHELAASLYELERFSEAFTTQQEAVTLKRELFNSTPDLHRAGLAQYLTNFGIFLSKAQRFSDACVAHQEAVTLQRNLFDAAPDTHRADLARYLNDLAESLDEVQRFSDAYIAIQEAVTLQQELFNAAPDPNRAQLALYLINLGHILHQVHRISDACDAIHQAVQNYRHLSSDDPALYRGAMLDALRLYALSLQAAGRQDDFMVVQAELSKLDLKRRRRMRAFAFFSTRSRLNRRRSGRVSL